jgi:hypothetical protein
MPGDEAAKLNGHANNNHTVVAVEREREREERDQYTSTIAQLIILYV